MMTAGEITGYMESLRNEKQRLELMRFFKTGPGEYGEGDEFLGLKVPQTREVVKLVGHDMSIDEVPELLMSRWHEVRLCGLLIMVERFEKLAGKRLLRYAERHLHHPHDLMHKAVGWMLREMGKRCSMDLLRQFLQQHVHEMPRTALRYAIEKMSPEERRHWLNA